MLVKVGFGVPVVTLRVAGTPAESMLNVTV